MEGEGVSRTPGVRNLPGGPDGPGSKTGTISYKEEGWFVFYTDFTSRSAKDPPQLPQKNKKGLPTTNYGAIVA